ncbi:amidohydrolase [Novosphingobium resinovorum]|uniref:amidohydrolase n=1 Tax=Novosphingobium resinovorum TaxID=158500 RepID=UPI002ED2B85B|nr:amidohydrolase [Novosphingobium resinovorum]
MSFRPLSAILSLSASAAVIAALAPVPAMALAEGMADLIITNARVYTVDEAHPWAEAVAIREGRIIAVGSAKDVAVQKGAQTQVVDLKGKLLLPAFGDAHNHPIFGGMSHARCALHSGRSIADYKRIIAKCIAETPNTGAGTGTIYGVGWEDGLFPPNGVPTKDILDSLSTTRPLIFRSTGGHSLWVNSKALQLAGVTKATKDPLNGKIDRDPKTGEPIGGLQESAQDLVEKLIPETTAQDLQDAIAYTVKHFNSLGITSWHDAGIEWQEDGSSAVIDAYKAVADKGLLTVDVAIDLKWKNEKGLEQLPGLLKASARARTLGITARSVKFYIDGVIPQQTAYMLKPYEGTKEVGAPQIPAQVLAAATTLLDEQGMQSHYHTIGDAAVREALDAVATARRSDGKVDTRPMISHLNVIDPADQPRFATLGVTAIFQPLWSCNEPYMDLTKERIGAVRSKYIYPVASVETFGGRVAYGADWSVASADPVLGLEVALTRTAPEDKREPLIASEGVTLAQAVKSYTLDVAYVNHLDQETGSIVPGKSADLVVLDKDIFKLEPRRIHEAKVLATVFKGKAVYGSLDAAAR